MKAIDTFETVTLQGEDLSDLPSLQGQLGKKAKTRTRILIAEDNPCFRSYLAHVMRMFDAEVVEVHDGWDAWQCLLSDDSIQLLLTDYDMPRMTGLEVIREIRRHALDVRVVAMSSLWDELLLERFREMGVNRFLEKPFNLEQLLEVVTLSGCTLTPIPRRQGPLSNC